MCARPRPLDGYEPARRSSPSSPALGPARSTSAPRPRRASTYSRTRARRAPPDRAGQQPGPEDSPDRRVAAGNYVPESASARMLRLSGSERMEMRRVQIAIRTKLQREGSRKNPPKAFLVEWTKAILTPRRSRTAPLRGPFPLLRTACFEAKRDGRAAQQAPLSQTAAANAGLLRTRFRMSRGKPWVAGPDSSRACVGLLRVDLSVPSPRSSPPMSKKRKTRSEDSRIRAGLPAGEATSCWGS